MQQNWEIRYGMITHRIVGLMTIFSDSNCKVDKYFLPKGELDYDLCICGTVLTWNEYFSHVVRWNDNHIGWCSHTCEHPSDGSFCEHAPENDQCNWNDCQFTWCVAARCKIWVRADPWILSKNGMAVFQIFMSLLHTQGDRFYTLLKPICCT